MDTRSPGMAFSSHAGEQVVRHAPQSRFRERLVRHVGGVGLLFAERRRQFPHRHHRTFADAPR